MTGSQKTFHTTIRLIFLLIRALFYFYSSSNYFKHIKFQKDGGRIYAVGQKFIKILPQAVKTFKMWTKHPEKTSLLHDKRFVHAILFSCCRQELKNGIEIDPAVIPFARGKSKIYFHYVTIVLISFLIFRTLPNSNRRG